MTPNQDDKRSVRTLDDLRAMSEAHELGYRTTADEVWERNPICLRCDIAWPCDVAEMKPLIDAQAKAIADVLALAEAWLARGHNPECPSGSGPCEKCAKAAGAQQIRRAITPDAPASEANGRPLHSSSTEQED